MNLAELGLAEYLDRKGISPKTIDLVKPLIKNKYIPKGDTLLDAIAGQECAFVLRKGLALEYFNFPNGQDTIAGIYPSGQLIIPSNLSNSNGRLSEIIGKSDIIVDYIKKKDLLNVCATDLELMELILSTTSLHLKMSCFFLSAKDVISKEEHICFMLSALLTNSRFLSDGKLIFTIDELCKFSGVSRQYYSKVLKKLESNNAISHLYGQLELVSLAKITKNFDENLLKLLKSFVKQTSVTTHEDRWIDEL